MNQEDIQLGGWHLKKEVTIGQIVTMITLVISLFVWATSVETRLTVLDERDGAMLDRIERQNQRFGDALAEIKMEIRTGFIRIGDKLDNKADK